MLSFEEVSSKWKILVTSKSLILNPSNSLRIECFSYKVNNTLRTDLFFFFFFFFFSFLHSLIR